MVSVNPGPAVRMVRRRQARRSVAVFAAVLLAVVLLPIGGPDAGAIATPVPLGTAGSFSVLAGSTVTNTGPSVVAGDIGVYPGSAIVGFPPGIVLPPGTIHAGDAVAAQAQTDLTTAYNNAAGQPADFILDSPELGGRTLIPGVYRSPLDAGTLQITGQVTLDAQGDPNAVWVFQIPSTLITAANSSVLLLNGAQPCNVLWQVGSSATLGTDTAFVGNILALA